MSTPRTNARAHRSETHRHTTSATGCGSRVGRCCRRARCPLRMLPMLPLKCRMSPAGHIVSEGAGLDSSWEHTGSTVVRPAAPWVAIGPPSGARFWSCHCSRARCACRPQHHVDGPVTGPDRGMPGVAAEVSHFRRSHLGRAHPSDPFRAGRTEEGRRQRLARHIDPHTKV